jgi:hypothetical protein
MTETPERSDQLPEEGPPESVPDDTGRPQGDDESAGAEGKDRTATGNPDAAGSQREDEGDSTDA